MYGDGVELGCRRAGLSEYFMGHRQQAGFVGHGIGIEINEMPVLAPRSKEILAEGRVFRARAEVRHSRRRSGRHREQLRRDGRRARKADADGRRNRSVGMIPSENADFV